MRLFILLILLFFFLESNAQDQGKIDSLLNLAGTDVSVLQKVDIYNEIAFNYRSVDSTKAMMYVTVALDLSRDNSYDIGKVDALNNQGWVMLTSSYYDEAEHIFLEALSIAQKSEYKKGEADANQNIGVSYWYRGRYSPALDYYLKALKLWEELDSKYGMAGARMNIGIIHWNQGDILNARENISESIRINESIQNLPGIAKGYTNLGVLYEEDGDLDGALENYLKAQQILKDIGDKRVLAYNYCNIGIIYDLKEEHKSAYDHFTKALTLFDEIGSTAEKALPLIDMGKSFYRQENYTLARKYLSQGVDLARQADFLSSVRDGSEYLALTEESLGNFQKAYEAHKLFKSMSDSIINEQQTKQIAKLEADYGFQKERDSLSFVQERERLAYEADILERSTNQWITLAGLIVVIIFLIGFVVFNRKLQRLNAEIRKQNTEITTQRDDLSRLNKAKSRFFSIISHDLRGPMGAIAGLSELISKQVMEEHGKDEDLEKMTSMLKTSSNRVIVLLDNLVKWALKEEGLMPFHPQRILLDECIQETVALLKPQADSKNISILSEINEPLIGYLDKNRMMTIFRNLISNSIKFTPEGGRVVIRGTKLKDELEVTVTDTGVGIPKEKLDKIYDIDKEKVSSGTRGELGTGLGLNLVRDFVHKNKGRIVAKSDLGVGTTFVLTFPSG